MNNRKTLLFGAALAAGTIVAVTVVAVQSNRVPPAPVARAGDADPLAYSPCSPAPVADDPLAYSPCSPAPVSTAP